MLAIFWVFFLLLKYCILYTQWLFKRSGKIYSWWSRAGSSWSTLLASSYMVLAQIKTSSSPKLTSFIFSGNFHSGRGRTVEDKWQLYSFFCPVLLHLVYLEPRVITKQNMGYRCSSWQIVGLSGSSCVQNFTAPNYLHTLNFPKYRRAFTLAYFNVIPFALSAHTPYLQWLCPSPCDMIDMSFCIVSTLQEHSEYVYHLSYIQIFR